MPCPFLEYHSLRGDSLPFCMALKPAPHIAEGIASRVCSSSELYHSCKSYTAAIIDVPECSTHEKDTKQLSH